MGIFSNFSLDDIKQKAAQYAKEGSAAAGSGVSSVAKALTPPKAQTIATTRKTGIDNKYKVDQHSYPMDLMGSPAYGGNYVVFYINISDASVLKTTEQNFELDKSTEANMRGSLVANADALKEGISKVGSLFKQALPETAASIDTEAIKNAVPIHARSQRRLATAIALHIPNQLSIRYGMDWGDADTAGAQALIQAGGAAAEALANYPEASKKQALDVAGLGAEYAFSKALDKLPPAAGGAFGLASNPKKEQLFQGVQFRNFTFDYQFYPRDEFEAENVLNIIHKFKLHMHPEFKSELNYVWIYPSEFDIIYYTNGGENLNLHRHTSCVLKTMSVNYTPNGNFSVFANGMPTQINVSLEFQELQLASKETIGLSGPGGL